MKLAIALVVLLSAVCINAHAPCYGKGCGYRNIGYDVGHVGYGLGYGGVGLGYGELI